MICGIKAIDAMCKGLRKNFFVHTKIFFPIILSKLKDKKTAVIEETHKALETMVSFCIQSYLLFKQIVNYFIDIEDILEEVSN